ncbi:MAG: formyltransferase family protein, partial [Planctomycetota bacterium]
MQIKTVGLITYHHPHLKTEQVLQRLLGLNTVFDFRMYALPFSPRKPREILLHHRPEQSDAIAPQTIAEKHKIPYVVCKTDQEIGDSCDIYLVLGAGILSAECVQNKKIINCHPGIIPSCRGLDSFKWAIYEMKPLGITLHYIDAQVDAGEIISVIPTNVYSSDSLATLARRHYENEINALSHFANFLETP